MYIKSFCPFGAAGSFDLQFTENSWIVLKNKQIIQVSNGNCKISEKMISNSRMNLLEIGCT